MQAALRQARAPAPAPGASAEYAGALAADIAGAPTADAPAQAAAEAPTVYVSAANVAVQSGPGDAPFGAGAPAAIGFLPLLGGYPGPEPEPTPQQVKPDLHTVAQSNQPVMQSSRPGHAGNGSSQLVDLPLMWRHMQGLSCSRWTEAFGQAQLSNMHVCIACRHSLTCARGSA